MNQLNIKSLLGLIIRGVIGAFMIYSGASKLIRPIEYFEISINSYAIIPDLFVSTIAYLVPWVEVFFGTTLLLGYAYKISCRILFLLFLMFQFLLGQALVRRLPINECGCFGGGSFHLTLYQSFALDSLIIFLLLYILNSEIMFLSIDNFFNVKIINEQLPRATDSSR